MSESSFKNINKLAFPSIIASISEPLIGLVDTAIVGHLGTDQLGAIGISSSFYMLIVWILSQTKSAISAIVSKALGRNMLQEMETLILQSVFLNVLFGVIFMMASLAFAENIFSFYNAEGKVLEYSLDYFNIRSWGLPISLATYGIFGIFRGLQNTLWAMWISLGGGLINLVLDLILVYGIEGYIPTMGVKGAALASVIAQGFMLLAALYMLYRKSGLNIRWTFILNKEFKNLFVMSLDLFVRSFAVNTAYFLSIKYATSYGKSILGAHTIAMNIWLFSAFFIDGYSNAGNAIAGKLLGKTDWGELQELKRKILSINLKVGVGLSLSYLILYAWIPDFFTDDEEVIRLHHTFFWLVIISQPLNAIAFSLDGLLKGTGSTVALRNSLMFSTFAVFVPTLLLFDFLGTGIFGVWIAFLFWMVSRALTLNRSFNLMVGNVPM